MPNQNRTRSRKRSYPYSRSPNRGTKKQRRTEYLKFGDGLGNHGAYVNNRGELIRARTPPRSPPRKWGNGRTNNGRGNM